MVETRRTFDEQLQEVRADVVKLAVKTCEQIGAATQALLDADLTVVDDIYDVHREITERVLQIEHRVYQLFALQQPMASDLRAMLTVLRILHEIELTGGLMRNVARATRRLYPRELPRASGGSSSAWARRPASRPTSRSTRSPTATRRSRPRFPTWTTSWTTSKRSSSGPSSRVSRASPTDEAALQMAVQLAFVGRDYERAADHAVMIGRWVEFMVTGQLPGDVEPT